MIHKKRLFYPAVLAATACAALALALHAESLAADNPPQTQPPPPHHGPPPMPLFDALDTNHDGAISAEEITNASTALKALLKDGATQITREDVRPPAPAHRPLPRDDRDRDEAAPSHRRFDDERADHPHHRPPPPEDRLETDGEARSHPHMGDNDEHPHHRPPPPPRDDD